MGAGRGSLSSHKGTAKALLLSEGRGDTLSPHYRGLSLRVTVAGGTRRALTAALPLYLRAAL